MMQNAFGVSVAERRLFALLVVGALVSSSGCGSSDDGDPAATAGGSAAAGKATGGAGRGGDGGSNSGGLGPAGSEATGSGGDDAGAGGTSGGNAGGTAVDAGGTTGDGVAGQAGNTDEVVDDSHVHGRVVELETAHPLAGRTVVLGTSLAGASRTTSDEHGEFTFERPPGSYDVAVLEPDGSAITVYKGLTRADLVLAHRWTRTFRTTTEVARVTGTVSGGASYPLSDARDLVTVHLFTDEGVDSYAMGAGGPPYGPGFVNTGRFNHGPLDAVQVAVGTFGRKDDMPASDPAYTAFATTHRLKLADGDMIALNLELEPVELGDISGAVKVPDGRHVTEMREHYRYPFPEALLDFPATDFVRRDPITSGGAFAFELPVLSEAGASLCLVGTSDEADTLSTERCGVAFGDDSVSIELEPAPVLTAPSEHSTIDLTTEFDWSPFADGISDVSFWPSDPSSAVPGVTILTANTTASLADLDALGVRLPTDEIYQVIITGRGRYGSIDEALGPAGIGAPIPAEARISVGAAVLVKTSP